MSTRSPEGQMNRLEDMQLDAQEFKEKLWYWLEQHPEINPLSEIALKRKMNEFLDAIDTILDQP